jgi:hypothetical protein
MKAVSKQDDLLVFARKMAHADFLFCKVIYSIGLYRTFCLGVI